MIRIMKKQSLNLIGYISIIMVILGLHSCEYESNNINYVELDKPEDEVQIAIDLAGVNPEEIIYVENNSIFYYTLFTDGRDILLLQLFWDGVPIETNQNSGEGIIYVENIDDNIHELKLVIAFKTGTESLAERSGLEMYAGEYNFKVKVFDNNYDGLNLRQEVNSDGHLKLEWDKPNNFEVEGYNVYHGDKNWGELLATIYDPDETFFVDTDYTYGFKRITVEAVVKNSLYSSTFDEINISYTTITEEQFEVERKSNYEFSVKWKNPNPFPCKYVLTRNLNNDITVYESDGEWVNVPALPFPTFSNQYYIYLLPKDADTSNYESYPNIMASFYDKKLSYIDITVNKSEGLIHTLNFSSVDTYDINTMEIVYSAKQAEVINTGSIIKKTPNGLLSYNMGFGNIHIFSDYKLENKVATFESSEKHYYPLSNNRLLIPEYAGFTIYDINNKDNLLSKTWYKPNGLSTYNPEVNVSPDGNYIYVQCTEHLPSGETNNWIEVYELKDNSELSLLSNQTIENRLKLHFNPNNNNEVIAQNHFSKDNKFIIKNIKTNREKEIKGEIKNIDPFTNNILYRDEDFYQNQRVKILSGDYNSEIMSIGLNSSTSNDMYLINNKLFMLGVYVDLSTLKEWKQ